MMNAKIKRQIWDFINSFNPEIKLLQLRVKGLKDELEITQKALEMYRERAMQLYYEKKTKEEEQADAEYWNNKWKKNKVVYQNSDGTKFDVRNKIITKSSLIEGRVKRLKGKTHDETALNVLKFVGRYLTYLPDRYNKLKQPEYWYDPETTWQMKQGDCEDGALLIISICRMLGIPAYRIKACAGWVKVKNKKEGHCYAIYLADDGEWYNLDWCYWHKESVANFKKVPHKDNEKYGEIWFTFNDELCWAQKSTKIGEVKKR